MAELDAIDIVRMRPGMYFGGPGGTAALPPPITTAGSSRRSRSCWPT